MNKKEARTVSSSLYVDAETLTCCIEFIVDSRSEGTKKKKKEEGRKEGQIRRSI